MGRDSMSNLEKAGRLLRLMGWISLVGVVGIIAAAAVPALSEGPNAESLINVIPFSLLLLLIPIIYLTVGSAVKQGKKWGKITGIIIALVSLLSLPIGTICGIAILIYLKKGWAEYDVESCT